MRGNDFVEIDTDEYFCVDYDEVYEKYDNLEKIEIEDIWQKYVSVSQEGNKGNV